METLKVTFEGNFGFFRRSDVRAYSYKVTKPFGEREYSYSHIHKITIMGILGAIIGLEGYNQQKIKKIFSIDDYFLPEFYRKLEKLKIGIVPNSESANFEKTYAEFVEAQGYLNKGNSLGVIEQWLTSPSWDIYLDLSEVDSEISEKIHHYLENKLTEFIPYIGKNDHPLVVKNVEKIELLPDEDEVVIHSLMKIDDDEFLEEIVEDIEETEATFLFVEENPISLNNETSLYEFGRIVSTDSYLNIPHYKDLKNHRNIVFI